MNKYILSILTLVACLWVGTIHADTVTVNADGATTTSSSGEASGGECKLTEVPDVMKTFRANMQTLADAATDLANGSRCREPEVGNPEWNKAIAIITGGASVQRIAAQAKTLSETINHTLTGIDFYFRADNSAVPDYLLKHQEYLLEIDEIIGKVTTEVGKRCGAGIEFTENVELEDATYTTAGATIQTVITDMTRNHRDVTRFIRNLALQREPTRMDESLIPIAPAGFDETMRAIYTQENINACEEAQPETQEMKEAIKETMTSGWKYDDAIKVWKEAFQMLVFRKDAAKAESDENKDEPGNFIARIAGGISRSGKLQSDEEKKGTGQSTNDRSFSEHIKSAVNNIAYLGQRSRNDRIRFTIRDVFSFLQGSNNTQETQQASTVPLGDDGTGEGGQLALNPTELTEIDDDLLSVVTTLVDLNITYEEIRSDTLTPEGSQAAYDVAPIVDSIYYADKTSEQVKANMEKACEVLDTRVATNAPNSTCQEIKDNVLEVGAYASV